MSDTKYTPGPWRAATDHPYTTDAGTDCVSVFALSDAEKRPARVHGDTEEQAIANARLIAVAPELLESLTRAMVWLNKAEADGLHLGCAAPNDLPQCRAQAEAAIAKATP